MTSYCRARRVKSPALIENLEARRLLAAGAGAGAGPVPRPDHVVIAIEENRNFEEMIGSPDAPYINWLASQGAVFTDYYALGRPSQPNYIGLFSGSFQGVFDNSSPHTFSAPSLGGELIKAGFEFGAYSEDLPFPGYEGVSWDGYVRRHAPWVNFTDVPQQTHRPFTDFPSGPAADFDSLPDLSFVVPNLVNGMHDDTVARGDEWLRQNLDPYVRWALAHNSLFILTWDEANFWPVDNTNRILTLMVGPMVKPGLYPERYDHYGLLRTLEEMWGLPLLGASATATPITAVWRQEPRAVGRRVFYNNSALDGGSAEADGRDDAAVAPDKHALVPGERATPRNYTSYSRGINGVMVDVVRLPAQPGGEPGMALTADDFTFKVGSGADAGTWADAPAPSAVTVRRGAGKAGSDRVTLTWPDGAIRNQWLRVEVKATPRTGLERPDVFYFGNMIGESVPRPTRLAGALGEAEAARRTFEHVSAADLAAARRAVLSSAAGAGVGADNPFDHDRDGRLTALDLLLVRVNLLRALRLLAVPVPTPLPNPPPSR